MDEIYNAVVQNSADDDYINPVDGLKYCGKCYTPKEAFFSDDMDFGGMKTHPAPCHCAKEQHDKEERKRIVRENAMQIAQLRMGAFKDIPAALWRFDRAGVNTPQLTKAQKYVENRDELSKYGLDLLLFGGVGTGKTYAAGCIVNALTGHEISVLMVGVSDAVNRMQGNFGADRDAYLKSLMRPELLILDDLSAERDTSFGKERVFDVINRRRLTGKPKTITANSPVASMQKAQDIGDRRIYDRILEVSIPIRFDGKNFRKDNARHNMEKAARLLRD